jgi:transposase-like protein
VASGRSGYPAHAAAGAYASGGRPPCAEMIAPGRHSRMTGHTTMRKVSRLEVVQTGSRRRWTLEEKQRIVAESNSGLRAVSATTRRHGMAPSHLFWWRKLAREGRLRADDEAVGLLRRLLRVA